MSEVAVIFCFHFLVFHWQWLKLDELLEQERNIRQAMFNRAGVLGLMLHQTLDHSLLMPTGVPPQHQAQVATTSI